MGDTDARIEEALIRHAEHASPSTTTKEPTSGPIFRDPPQRVVVLAVDNARGLVSYANRDDVRRLERLRCALYAVNTLLRSTHRRNIGIVGLFVDSHSQIIEPPRSPPPEVARHLNPSIREQTEYTRFVRVESPETFVASHTVDAWFDNLVARAKTDGLACAQMYQAMVCNKDAHQQWMTLVRMGRPLWFARHLHLSTTDLVQLAADKLDAVAAVLCRTGFRANSWSPLAKRLVADNMATLASVDTSQSQFVSAYASEPLLAFGAMHAWYFPREALEQTILPQFRCVLDENPDAIVIAEDARLTLVARLVVLLAMDTVSVSSYHNHESGRGEATTEFQSVDDFIRVLHGKGDGVMEPSTPVVGAILDKSSPVEIVMHLQAEWCEWKVGFTYFVEMYEEPSEDVLWALLPRRAACAFPRRLYDSGVDLLLPIFSTSSPHSPQVSAIRIFVSRHADDHPPLVGDQPAEGIRVCMRPQINFEPERLYETEEKPSEPLPSSQEQEEGVVDRSEEEWREEQRRQGSFTGQAGENAEDATKTQRRQGCE